MMLCDSLPIVRLRTQVTQSSPWPLVERTYTFWGHCKYFIDFFTTLSLWKSKKILELFYRFYNDCVTIEIRETDSRSPVEGGEQITSFHAPRSSFLTGEPGA